MTAPLLVLRVGYMERYDGMSDISSGGAHIDENGVGGEIFNFKPSRGKCYGYAMSTHFAGVNLRALASGSSWESGDELPGVDVVFIARRPGVGQVVVGWYRNATVFHQQYRVRRGNIPGMRDSGRQYLCVANASDAYLLPEEGRTFSVPSGPAGNKGFPGRSNVWYPTSNDEHRDVKAFARRLKRYIDITTAHTPTDDGEASRVARKGGGRRRAKPDPAHNAAVEQAAVDIVTLHFKAKGYAVESVESDKKGWDLEATKGRQGLLLEVKGTSGAEVYFELTPNEYFQLQQKASRFRVCVVCDALGEPRLYVLAPRKTSRGWSLRSQDRAVFVPLMERVAAVGVEVASNGGDRK